MIQTVLFDLDGTLLPMDQDTFIKRYFSGLTAAVANDTVNAARLIQVMMRGVEVMQNNDGRESNKAVFDRLFTTLLGADGEALLPAFDAFYQEGFDRIAEELATPDARLQTLVAQLKQKGCRLVLATSPMFPTIAVHKRIGWAGLHPDDFAYITTYENCSHSKPNPLYYADILRDINVAPEEAVMIGNDVDEDMVAETVGMRVFLLTDHLVNRGAKDISCYPHGSVEALYAYLTQLHLL